MAHEIGPPPSPNRYPHPYVGTMDFQGLPIMLEHLPGDVRVGNGPQGAWRTRMKCYYGEVTGTLGRDGDPVDVYVGPNPNASIAYVYRQRVPGTNKLDELKVCLGFDSEEEARKCFRGHNDQPIYHSMTPWPIEKFKEHLRKRGSKHAGPMHRKHRDRIVIKKASEAASIGMNSGGMGAGVATLTNVKDKEGLASPGSTPEKLLRIKNREGTVENDGEIDDPDGSMEMDKGGTTAATIGAMVPQDLEGDAVDEAAEEERKNKREQMMAMREQMGKGTSDLLPGGRADQGRKRGRNRFYSRQALNEGIAHEMEHTDDPKIAREIAEDHLWEDPGYYRKLAKMEKGSRIVLRKAGPIKGKAGLVFDKQKHRWVKTGQEQAGAAQGEATQVSDSEKPPHIGQEASFRHSETGQEVKGNIVSSGEHGVTVEHGGEHHQVEHGNYHRKDSSDGPREGVLSLEQAAGAEQSREASRLAQMDSTAFKSEVESGIEVEMFRGTSEKADKGGPSWFSTDPSKAVEYATRSQTHTSSAGVVHRETVAMKKPYLAKASEIINASDGMIKDLKSQGYDGIVAQWSGGMKSRSNPNPRKQVWAVVFDFEQPMKKGIRAFFGRILLRKAKKEKADYFRKVSGHNIPFKGTPGKGVQVGGFQYTEHFGKKKKDKGHGHNVTTENLDSFVEAGSDSHYAIDKVDQHLEHLSRNPGNKHVRDWLREQAPKLRAHKYIKDGHKFANKLEEMVGKPEGSSRSAITHGMDGSLHVVRGETRPLADELKRRGFRWNGAEWSKLSKPSDGDKIISEMTELHSLSRKGSTPPKAIKPAPAPKGAADLAQQPKGTGIHLRQTESGIRALGKTAGIEKALSAAGFNEVAGRWEADSLSGAQMAAVHKAAADRAQSSIKAAPKQAPTQRQVDYAHSMVSKLVRSGGWHDFSDGAHRPPSADDLSKMSRKDVSKYIDDLRSELHPYRKGFGRILLRKAARVPADYFRWVSGHNVPFIGKPGAGIQVGGFPYTDVFDGKKTKGLTDKQAAAGVKGLRGGDTPGAAAAYRAGHLAAQQGHGYGEHKKVDASHRRFWQAGHYAGSSGKAAPKEQEKSKLTSKDTFRMNAKDLRAALHTHKGHAVTLKAIQSEIDRRAAKRAAKGKKPLREQEKPKKKIVVKKKGGEKTVELKPVDGDGQSTGEQARRKQAKHLKDDRRPSVMGAVAALRSATSLLDDAERRQAKEKKTKRRKRIPIDHSRLVSQARASVWESEQKLQAARAQPLPGESESQRINRMAATDEPSDRVYKGGNGEWWVMDMTSGKVIPSPFKTKTAAIDYAEQNQKTEVMMAPEREKAKALYGDKTTPAEEKDRKAAERITATIEGKLDHPSMTESARVRDIAQKHARSIADKLDHHPDLQKRVRTARAAMKSLDKKTMPVVNHHAKYPEYHGKPKADLKKELQKLDPNPHAWAPKPVRQKPKSVTDPELFHRRDAIKTEMGLQGWQQMPDQASRVLSMPPAKHKELVTKHHEAGAPIPKKVLDHYGLKQTAAQRLGPKPWERSGEMHANKHGPARRNIMEISLLQRQRMSKRAVRQYDAQRRADSDARGKLHDEWRNAVQSAAESGAIDMNTPNLSKDARSIVLRHRADKRKAAASAEHTKKVASLHVATHEVKKGDRVWVAEPGHKSNHRGWGTVIRGGKKTARIKLDKPLYGDVHEMKTKPGWNPLYTDEPPDELKKSDRILMRKAERVPADYFRWVSGHNVPFIGKPGAGVQVGGFPYTDVFDGKKTKGLTDKQAAAGVAGLRGGDTPGAAAAYRAGHLAAQQGHGYGEHKKVDKSHRRFWQAGHYAGSSGKKAVSKAKPEIKRPYTDHDSAMAWVKKKATEHGSEFFGSPEYQKHAKDIAILQAEQRKKPKVEGKPEKKIVVKKDVEKKATEKPTVKAEKTSKPAPAPKPQEGELFIGDRSNRILNRDFGERIEGAKKHKWETVDSTTLHHLEAQGSSAAFKHVTKAKVLGKHDHELARERGDTPGASWLKAEVYKLVPAKPQDHPGIRHNYVRAVEYLKKNLDQLHTPDEINDFLKEWALLSKGKTRSAPMSGAELIAKVGAGSGDRYAGGGYTMVDDTHVTYSDLRKHGYSGVDWGETVGGKRQYHLVTTDPSLKETYGSMLGALGKRAIDGIVNRRGAFHRSRHKGAYLDDQPHAAVWGELTKKKVAGKDKGKRGPDIRKRIRQRKGSNLDRVGGPSVKSGATEKDLGRQFGLRGGQFGNTLSDERAGYHVQKAHEAFTDLADVLGLEPKQMSAGGLLGMAFGARGSGSARAHYEPDQLVINITNSAGAGTLAHEWGHFLDNMLTGSVRGVKDADYTPTSATTRRAKFLSHREGMGNLTPATEKALHGVLGAIMHGDPNSAGHMKAKEAHKERWNKLRSTSNELRKESIKVSQFLRSDPKRSEAMDAYNAKVKAFNKERAALQKASRVMAGKRGNVPSEYARHANALGSYWAKNHEMFARAFESYVEDKLHTQGRRSPYLTTGTQEAMNITTKDGEIAEVYPQGDERKAINKAFDKFFDELRKTDTLKKAIEAFNMAQSHGDRILLRKAVPADVFPPHELVYRRALERAVEKNRSEEVERFAEPWRELAEKHAQDLLVDKGEKAFDDFLDERDRVEAQLTDSKARNRLMMTSLITAGGDRFETGVPVIFRYMRNQEGTGSELYKRPEKDTEPAGNYVLHMSAVGGGKMPTWETGSMSFNNPLVLEWGAGTDEAHGWRQRLSAHFGGRKGYELSRHLRIKGFDGVVAVRSHWKEVGEVVDIRRLSNLKKAVNDRILIRST